jgi:hypothetical protein
MGFYVADVPVCTINLNIEEACTETFKIEYTGNRFLDFLDFQSLTTEFGMAK